MTVQQPPVVPLRSLKAVVIEGPAGSGKSTLIRKMMQDRALWVLPEPIAQFERPRAYEGLGNLALSQLKDQASMLSVMTYLMSRPPEDMRVPILDRWMLSQMVYGRLRRQEGLSLPSLTSEMTTQFKGVHATYQELMSRGGHYESKTIGILEALQLLVLPRVQVFMAVVIPEAGLLSRTRMSETGSSGRKYPYPVVAETVGYQAISNCLRDVSSELFGLHYLKVKIYKPSSFEELDGLPEIIHQHVETHLMSAPHEL